MTIYEHKVLLTAAAGSIASSTLRIPGGVARYFLARANSGSTVFRADLTDEDGVLRINYGYHTGEIRDDNLRYPLTGVYTVNITNASYNDQFRIILGVQE